MEVSNGITKSTLNGFEVFGFEDWTGGPGVVDEDETMIGVSSSDGICDFDRVTLCLGTDIFYSSTLQL